MNNYTYEELYIGQKESFTVTVSKEDFETFRHITGDENPLHNDEEYAGKKGNKGRVAFGMLTASYLSALAGVYLPGERSLIHSVEVKFEAPVYEGDVLTVSGEVKEKNDTFRFIILKVFIKNPDGKKVLKGKMQIGVTD
ncbi:MAG: MaoC family dehydratase [Lachnospiraceae bacterium]|nr:MaoC family dehydratase [Lachnospiraceae bacterium]